MNLSLTLVLLWAVFASSSASTKLSLALYYESLCPDCHVFVKTQLTPTVQKLEGLFDVVLVPYGNARLVNGTIECQHGPEECYGNLVQACQQASPGASTRQSLAFITCMSDQANPSNTNAAAKTCAKKLGLNWKSLSACANGHDGAKLIAANKAKTEALKPRHEGVPWVTLNGVRTDDRYESDLLVNLCKDYFPKAPSCKKVRHLAPLPVGH